MPDFDLDTYIDDTVRALDEYLDRVLPPVDGSMALHEAIRYCVFNGGKRFRAVLTMASCEAFGGDLKASLPAGAGIELIHASSLIHDDLPCMDDADLRRGRPSCHKAYDEAMAVLVGDWLITYPFQLLSDAEADSTGLSCGQRLQLMNEIARSICSSGIVEGQVEDLAAEDQEIGIEDLKLLHAHKTGALIEACARCGLICAGVEQGHLDEFSAFAKPLGLAFQIADDILDATSDEETLGKPVGADVDNLKNTYVSFFGLERAKQLAEETAQQAHGALDRLPDTVDTRVLRALVDFVVSRGV